MRAVPLALAILAGCSSTPPPAPVAPAPVLAPPPPAPVVPVADPAPQFRLPGDVKPTQYALELTIIPGEPKATGRVQIAAEVVKPTRVVWLHATELEIGRVALGGQPARIVKGDDDSFGITLDRELPTGPLAIDVAFAAGIDPKRSRGLYSEREGSDTYVYTFFEPVDARRAFPCFDEPGYKVPWQLTFHIKQDQLALANAAVVSETPEPDGMKRVEIAVTKPLPAYLVAFVVGPFELVDGGTAGRADTPIRYIIPKGRAGELGYAQQVTPKVVVALEDYFGMAYPYGKLDVAVVPRYWGTMEHPGIVAMGQPLTLIRPEQETRQRKRGYASILAHELSHYWFGDYVTMAWWEDTWLNEALGSWSDLNITEAAEPGWRLRDDRVAMSLGAMAADETLSTRAMHQPVTTREGIQASFDNQITYSKGAAMFRMFESFVGRDKWQQFIRRYLNAYAWRNASAEDFLREVVTDFGQPTADAMRSFLDQPGVPRISGQLRCDARSPAKIELTQQRSLPAGVTDESPKRWGVPVCLRYGNARTSARTCVTLTEPTATFELPGAKPGTQFAGCPTWTILNSDAIGYYRSVVDPAIARQLLTPSSPIARAAKPTAPERMMLVEDLHAAVTRDELTIDKLLALVPLVAADPDDKVARFALAAGDLPMRGLDDAMYRAAIRWRLATFRARATQLGWQRNIKDSEERHQLRLAFVPLIADHAPALTAEAKKLADRWLTDRSGLPDDLVGPALYVAARHGDAARFERTLAAVKAAPDRTEQQRLLGTLGGFSDPALATKALAVVLGTDLDLRETRIILFSLIRLRESRDLTLAFLAEHLDELLARLRDDEAAGVLAGIAGAFCDPERKAKAAELVTARAAKIDGAQSAVTRGLEQSDQCIALVARQLPALRRALGAK